ncbi:hypothetical protein TA3x_005397 [Tundrisphaera sp. TA3]|uniref:hypothetical protein n=1 Tax=Tundrisphaera sp. TA3 TaxID=3435775 RepID=UPI003EB94E91
MAHILAIDSISRSGRYVTHLVRAGGWPDWMAAQGEKNRRKALVYAGWGIALLVATLVSRGGWHATLCVATLAYHLGAFASEGLLIATQDRLLRDYQSRSVAERPV